MLISVSEGDEEAGSGDSLPSRLKKLKTDLYSVDVFRSSAGQLFRRPTTNVQDFEKDNDGDGDDDWNFHIDFTFDSEVLELRYDTIRYDTIKSSPARHAAKGHSWSNQHIIPAFWRLRPPWFVTTTCGLVDIIESNVASSFWSCSRRAVSSPRPCIA
jgi:hypothetical protein